MTESLLSRALVTGRARYNGLPNKYRGFVVGALCLAVVLLVSFYALRPGPAPDLSDARYTAGIESMWSRGDLVILVRHAERCDHSTNPCLAQPDGITVKGQAMAQELGNSFRAVGLQNADIYNSPLARTTQTSMFAFGQATVGQEWLFNCRKTMLDDILKHKVEHRNLILVTHSECMDHLEKTLKVSARTTLDHGTSLFVSVDQSTHTAKVLGYIDPHGWKNLIDSRAEKRTWPPL